MKSVKQILNEDKNPEFAARWSTNPEHLERLSQHKEWVVRASVARNSATPHHILDALSKDSSLFVKIFVAQRGIKTIFLRRFARVVIGWFAKPKPTER